MGEVTKIGWCDHTFNPWIGCTRVSAACDNCYAAALMDDRLGRAKWGAGNPRSLTTPDYWKQPRRWDRKAKAEGVRRTVFCASLADIFDTEVDPQWRIKVFQLIEETPNLDWLLLTKRPAAAFHYYNNQVWPKNACVGTTVEDQKTAEARIPWLRGIKHAKYRFLSMEPLLEPVDISYYLTESQGGDIDWVIVGGESGNHVRPMNPDWARSLLVQCRGMGVPFFMKQMSGRTTGEQEAIPDDLMVREFVKDKKLRRIK